MPDGEIRLDHLRPHPDNPRTTFDAAELAGLARSIAITGIQVPLIVCPDPKARGQQRYLIIDGERRWRACHDVPTIDKAPVEIRATPVTPGAALTDMALINWQRATWLPMEKARALDGIMRGTPGMTQAKLATRLGLTAQTVSYHLSLLDLTAEAQAAVDRGEIAVGHAHHEVTEARAAQRGGYRPPNRKVHVEPPWFGKNHDLASVARSLCLGQPPGPAQGRRGGVRAVLADRDPAGV